MLLVTGNFTLPPQSEHEIYVVVINKNVWKWRWCGSENSHTLTRQHYFTLAAAHCSWLSQDSCSLTSHQLNYLSLPPYWSCSRTTSQASSSCLSGEQQDWTTSNTQPSPPGKYGQSQLSIHTIDQSQLRNLKINQSHLSIHTIDQS